MEETKAIDGMFVTLPVEFYNELIAKMLAFELFQNALIENAELDYCNKVNVADHFIYAVQAILPDTYAKMAEKVAKSEEE